MSEVLIYSSKDKKSHWQPCQVVNSYDALDRPVRYDVTIADGRTYHGCAPECVREATQ